MNTQRLESVRELITNSPHHPTYRAIYMTICRRSSCMAILISGLTIVLLSVFANLQILVIPRVTTPRHIVPTLLRI